MVGNKLEYVGTVWIEIFAYGRSRRCYRDLYRQQ